jgi:hypothetical protein
VIFLVDFGILLKKIIIFATKKIKNLATVQQFFCTQKKWLMRKGRVGTMWEWEDRNQE